MIPDAARDKWIGPKPVPPTCRIGDVLTCALRGAIRISRWHDGDGRASVAWPKGRPIPAGRGGGFLVMTDELAASVRIESELAIMRYLAVSKSTVRSWRRALGVGRITTGTRELRKAETGTPETFRSINKTHPHNWTPPELAMLGTMSDEAAARRLGKSVSAVKAQRIRSGIAANNVKTPGRPRRTDSQ